MKQKKIILLFLALFFPICIFLFLKIFGKNEFTVAPLYQDVLPEKLVGCTDNNITLPYVVPDSVQSRFTIHKDSLGLIYFGDTQENSAAQLKRVKKDFGNSIKLFFVSPSEKSSQLSKCVFFLRDTYDLVLMDATGKIRGQYIAGDREEVDRLLAELTILFRRY